MQPLTEETRQRLYDEYRNELDGGFGFGDPKLWCNGPRTFQAFLAHRRIVHDFDKALAHVIKVCADHPKASIRHTWTQQQVVLNGYPSGAGFTVSHEYSCAECHKKLEGST